MRGHYEHHFFLSACLNFGFPYQMLRGYAINSLEGAAFWSLFFHNLLEVELKSEFMISPFPDLSQQKLLRVCLYNVRLHIHSFAPQSVLRQVHSLFQREFSTECDPSSFNFQCSVASLRSFSSCLNLRPHTPVTSTYMYIFYTLTPCNIFASM